MRFPPSLGWAYSTEGKERKEKEEEEQAVLTLRDRIITSSK
jgi:hypothetical protein